MLRNPGFDPKDLYNDLYIYLFAKGPFWHALLVHAPARVRPRRDPLVHARRLIGAIHAVARGLHVGPEPPLVQLRAHVARRVRHLHLEAVEGGPGGRQE